VNYWEGNKNVQVIRGDINDKEKISELLKYAWGVLHLAAEMDSSLPWEVFQKVNVDSVKNLIRLTPKEIRLVIVSSVVVYKDTGSEMRDETWSIKSVEGVDKYVRSKLMAIELIRKSKRKVVTVMPSTVIDHEVFGREQFITDSWWWKWVWNNVGGGIPGGLMAAVGNKNRVMNFVDVRDVAEGIVLSLEKGIPGEEYILSGENITAGEYLIKMAKRCGKKYLRIRIPEIFLRMFGLGGVVNMKYSYEKAKKELGYNPCRFL
jgi:dihydroflavonol-4-reductase